MKTYRKYLKFLISILFITFALQKSEACLYTEYGEDLRISMFRLMHGRMNSYLPFQYSAHSFFSNGNPVSFDRERHLQEWTKACSYKGRQEDMELIIFKTPPEIFYYTTQKGQFNAFFLGNEFADFIMQTKQKNFFKYLEIAKAIEYYETKLFDTWGNYYPEENDKYGFLNTIIIDEINQLLRTEKNDFLIKRLAYQLLRMHFQNHDFASVIKIYQEYFNPVKSESIIDDWALHYCAIAEGIDGDTITSNYHKSLVFDRCDDKKYRMYTTFLRSPSALEKTISMAKNVDEQNNIRVMSIINYPGKALPTIIQLKNNHAKEEAIQFLTLREINKLEDWLLTTELTTSGPAVNTSEYWSESEEYLKKNYAADRAYLLQMIDFCNNQWINTAGEVKQWYALALAHLHIMNDNPNLALQILPDINIIDNEQFKQQVLIEKQFVFSSQSYILDPQSQSKAAENFLVLDVFVKKGNLNPMTMYSLCQRFSKAFIQKNDVARAMLMGSKATEYKNHLYSNDFPKDNTEYAYYLSATIDQSGNSEDVEKYMNILYEKPQKPLDQFISSQTYASKVQLMELKGSKLFREGKLMEALAQWEKLPSDFWTKNGEFNDYLGKSLFHPKEIYPASSIKKVEANKVELLKQICLLEDSIKTKSKNHYTQVLKLAHAWFNVSYYGSNWMLAHYYKSAYEEAEIQNSMYPGQPTLILTDRKNYLENQRALELYQSVISDCQDAELQCEAMVMMQFIRWVNYKSAISWEDQTKSPFKSPFNLGAWKKVSHTRFYKSIRASCPLFNTFVKK